MNAPTGLRGDSRPADQRILRSAPNGDSAAGATSALVLRRKKRTVGAILREFERLIEPLVQAGHEAEINEFKGVCRRKIGGLAHEASRLLEAQPGDIFNEAAIELAEDISAREMED